MQIDDKKRDSFINMMRGVADDYGCRVSFEWSSADPDNMTVRIIKDVLFVHESRIHWPSVKSQTDIATRIWSNFFNKYHSDPRISYGRYDVESTKAMLNSVYGRSAFDEAGSLSIKKVIFNDPATIVFWKDGTKTVVQCRGDDIYDPEKGLAMAISKKVFGNNYNYYKTFKKWVPKEKPVLNLNPIKEFTFEGILSSGSLKNLKFNGGTLSFDMKCVKPQDDLAEDLRDEIFNNAVPANRIRGEEKK